jgi:hypothetical protein
VPGVPPKGAERRAGDDRSSQIRKVDRRGEAAKDGEAGDERMRQHQASVSGQHVEEGEGDLREPRLLEEALGHEETMGAEVVGRDLIGVDDEVTEDDPETVV